MKSFNEWPLENGQFISLLTLKEFNELPNGTKLVNIFGEELEKTDQTDKDTRGGFVAYGLPPKVETK